MFIHTSTVWKLIVWKNNLLKIFVYENHPNYSIVILLTLVRECLVGFTIMWQAAMDYDAEKMIHIYLKIYHKLTKL